MILIKQWIRYLLWIVGMFLVMNVVSRIEISVHQQTLLTFSMTREVWIVTLISFFIGVYLSLLFISGKPQLNIPLFVCVFIPATLIGFYYPFVLEVHFLRIPAWLLQFDNFGLIHYVSGLSLMMSLLNGKKRSHA